MKHRFELIVTDDGDTFTYYCSDIDELRRRANLAIEHRDIFCIVPTDRNNVSEFEVYLINYLMDFQKLYQGAL